MADRVGQQFGDYRLTQNLGSGGFADVYLGEHIYLGTQAAIKLLKGAFAQKDIDQFLAEAKTVVSLEHPNIVHVITFSVAEMNSWHIPFLVLEYAPNGTLRQRHPSGTALPLGTIIPYVRQISAALQYAHNKKFIHRDIKPENMLVGRHNEILLSDFGIALTTPQSGTLETQEMAGTVAYMAPEQIKGHPRAASDQYSLAVIVYEWLCGERPFLGPPWEVINKHFYADPPPLREKVPTISPAVEQVVLRALAKQPQQRFPTVHEFATALEQASQEAETLPAPRPANWPIAPQPVASPPSQVDSPANQPVSKLASMAPSEQATVFPTAQRANPVNQAAPQSPLPPTQVARQPNQAPVQQPSPPSPQPGLQLNIQREQAEQTQGHPLPVTSAPTPAAFPANDYATIQAPSPVGDINRPGNISTGVMNHAPTEGKRGPAVNKVALLVGLAVLVVVVGAGILLIPLLTHPGSTGVSNQAPTTTSPASLATSNGAMFGFDLQRTHFNPNEHTLTPTNVSGLVPDWTFTSGGFIDSSPAISNGMLYIGSDDHHLYAFKTSCGSPNCTPVWTGSTGDLVRSSPAVANGMVYVGSFDHKLYAFKAAGCGSPSCPPVWTATTGNVIRSSPAVANGIVYVGSEDGKLYAFNAANGKTIWVSPTEASIYFSSPAISNGTVYIGSEDSQLYAFDAVTGKLLWIGATGGMIFSSPAVANGMVYVGSGDGKLYAFKASGCGSSACQPIWATQAGNSIQSSPAVANGVVYVGSDDHHLYALDAATGNIHWRGGPAGNVVRSSPTVADGVVYVGSDDGKMYVFNASGCDNGQCQPVWTYQTAGLVFSSAAVVNGVLYFGSTDHHLYAFHLKGATP
jgi:outer membrane protein assembly factor BamB/serine/threonine protein kinase